MKQLFSMVLATMARVGPCAEVVSKFNLNKGVFSAVAVLCLLSPTVLAQTVELSVSANSDSEGTTGMNYRVMRYANAKCQKAEKPRKLFYKKFASASQVMGPTQIPVVDQFWFQINYQENRRAEERSCDFLLGFKPIEGRRYEAALDISGQVSSCRLSLFDITDNRQEIAFTNPEYSCKKVNKLGKPNGAPVHNSLKRF